MTEVMIFDQWYTAWCCRLKFKPEMKWKFLYVSENCNSVSFQNAKYPFSVFCRKHCFRWVHSAFTVKVFFHCRIAWRAFWGQLVTPVYRTSALVYYAMDNLISWFWRLSSFRTKLFSCEPLKTLHLLLAHLESLMSCLQSCFSPCCLGGFKDEWDRWCDWKLC